jgi:hypothetical protein
MLGLLRLETWLVADVRKVRFPAPTVDGRSLRLPRLHHRTRGETMTTRKWDAWNYRESTGISARQDNLTGFKVHAKDGDIGKIDKATREVGAGYVVVDTGPWIFGRKVMLPAGTVERVDWNDMTVYVDRTKNQIKDSPELGENSLTDRSYRDRVGTYYGDTYNERSSL